LIFTQNLFFRLYCSLFVYN